MNEKRYIIGGNDGWLRVKREPDGEVIALPEYLQVEFSHRQGGRDFFKAIEGCERGKTFSVKKGNLSQGSLAYKPTAEIEFNIKKHELSFPDGNVKAITLNGPSAIASGKHPIQIPDFPHELGIGYLQQSQYAKTWFYLGRDKAVPWKNDNYLHTGRISLGCVTVDPDGWTKLYQYLIVCRSGDGKTVGSIIVRL